MARQWNEQGRLHKGINRREHAAYLLLLQLNDEQ